MNRKDFKIISDWINNESTVLDLGCGDSTLLDYLVKKKNISGYGFEKDIDQVKESIKKNINVIQADFNNGLSDYFEANFFDYAIMTQALQENKNPDKIIFMPCGYGIKKTYSEIKNLGKLTRWKSLKAFQTGEVYIVDGSQYFNRPGPRLLDSIKIMDEIINDGISHGYSGTGWIKFD